MGTQSFHAVLKVISRGLSQRLKWVHSARNIAPMLDKGANVRHFDFLSLPGVLQLLKRFSWPMTASRSVGVMFIHDALVVGYQPRHRLPRELGRFYSFETTLLEEMNALWLGTSAVDRRAQIGVFAVSNLCKRELDRPAPKYTRRVFSA